jgi:hypothetical protein
MARKQSGSKPEEEQVAEAGTSENGHEEDVERYEQELAGYLEKRLKPGLNRGAIPLVARSIAKEIAHQEYPEETEEDSEGEDLDLQAELHQLQGKLGEDWVLYFCVHGDDTWLTAEKEDASQRLEAPTGSVLLKAVEVLNEGGGRSGSK